MSRFQLPFAQESEPLEEAMRRMRSQDRRAVVVHHTGPDYRLYMNLSVLDAYHEDVVECAGLRRFEGAPVAPFVSEAGRQSADYSLSFEPGAYDQSVELLTRTDELARSILTAVTVCRCKKNHAYDQPPPRDGTLCDHDKTVIKCV